MAQFAMSRLSTTLVRRCIFLLMESLARWSWYVEKLLLISETICACYDYCDPRNDFVSLKKDPISSYSSSSVAISASSFMDFWHCSCNTFACSTLRSCYSCNNTDFATNEAFASMPATKLL